jgi:hypothetical protein
MTYEKNLEIMNGLNWDLVERLEQIDDQSIVSVEINGTQIYQLTDDMGKSFYSASIVNPEHEADAMLASVNLDNKGYIVIGIPSVTFIEKLLTSTTNAAWLIIIEKDPALVKRFLREIPLLKYMKGGISHVYFVTGDQDEVQNRMRYILDTANGIYFFKPEVIRTFPTYRKDETFYNKALISSYEIIRNKCQVSGNQLHSTLKGIRQEIENLPALVKLPRLLDLKNKYKGKPIVCVASGPSLDKQLPMLKQLQGKVMILCAVSAFRVLIRNGIEPDIVSVLERGPEAIDICFNDMPIPKKTWLFVLSLVDPRLFSFWPNPVVPCFKQNTYLHAFMNQALGNMGSLVTAHSVAHLNFMLAHHLGAEPIILLGQDLAYADSGRTHSVHTHYEKEHQEKQNATEPQKVSYLNEEVYLDGYYGGKVRSKRIWHNFLTSLESMVLHIKTPVINATEGGAKIKGTTQRPFSEVFEEIKDGQFELLDSFKEDLFATIPPGEQRIYAVYEQFKQLLSEINEIIDEADNWLQTITEFELDLQNVTAENERYLLRQARSHSLYFDVLFERFFANEYLRAYFRPVYTMLHINTNPISRMKDVPRVIALFDHYKSFANIISRGGRLLVNTIEEQFQLILPATEADLADGDLSQLINDSLQSSREYIPALIDACDQLVEMIQQGNMDWVVLFGDFVSGINWINEVISGLQANRVEQVINISLMDSQALLRDCEEFLKNNDHVSFADCLGFGIKPLLESYLQELNAVAMK